MHRPGPRSPTVALCQGHRPIANGTVYVVVNFARLPMRVFQRSKEGMHLLLLRRRPLPKTGQRTRPGPHQRVRGDPAGGIREAGGRSPGPRLRPSCRPLVGLPEDVSTQKTQGEHAGYDV